MIETRQIDDLIVSVQVKPNRPGANFVAIRVIDTRRPALAPVTGVRLTVPGLATDARPSGEDEWQVAGLKIARAGALDLRVDVDRPGLPVSAAVRWTTGGAPAAARPVVSRRRLGPFATPFALALLALLLAVAVGYRRRQRTAIVLVALLAFPAAALAADDPPRVRDRDPPRRHRRQAVRRHAVPAWIDRGAGPAARPRDPRQGAARRAGRQSDVGPAPCGSPAPTP